MSEPKLTRHADHDPGLICRPALGYGLCEVLGVEVRSEEEVDAAAARSARASIAAGEPVIPWEQIKTEAEERPA